MTSTWSVITAGYFLAVSKHRFRLVMAFAAVLIFFYVIYISSSRAALLHLIAAGSLFCVLYQTRKKARQWFVLGGVYSALAILLAVCVVQCLPNNSVGASRSNAFETNIQRFVPGYGGSSASDFSSNRAENWPEYFSMMNEKVLTGWGYKMGVRLHEESPDNSYLSVMLETGAFGFLCMSVFVLSIFYLSLIHI